jgi:hypothetical protein
MADFENCMKTHLLDDVFAILQPGTLELVKVTYQREVKSVAKLHASEVPSFLVVLSKSLSAYRKKITRPGEAINIDNSTCGVILQKGIRHIVIQSADKTASITIRLKKELYIFLTQLRMCIKELALCSAPLLAVLRDAGEALSKNTDAAALALYNAWTDQEDPDNCLLEVCKNRGGECSVTFQMRFCYLNLAIIESFYTLRVMHKQLEETEESAAPTPIE